jgi:prenyltransferase beta subunit
MRNDPYEPNNFEGRVNYAARCISSGHIHGRNERIFDTCFEMWDGDQVAAALVRRILLQPHSRLADKLFTVLDRERAMQHYEETKHLTRKQLADAARDERARREAAA